MDYSSFGLRDKVAIVTGGSQGIGRAIALGLAQAGVHVVLAKYPDKRQDEVKAVKAEIEALGRRALILQTDLLGEIAICQLGGSLTQTAYALLSDLVTIRRRQPPAPHEAAPGRTP